MGCLASHQVPVSATGEGTGNKEQAPSGDNKTFQVEACSAPETLGAGKGRTQSTYVKKSIPKRTRDLVWVNNNGEVYFAPCYCCNRRIDVTNFEAGHVKAEREGGLTTLQNLLPICGQCNRSMGTENMISFAQRQGYPGRVITLTLETIGRLPVVQPATIHLNIVK